MRKSVCFPGCFFVRIIGTFYGSDELLVDCEKNRITKNGLNWIHHIDRTSSFTDMGLTPGDNTIGFKADSGDNNMEVYVYFFQQYLGI